MWKLILKNIWSRRKQNGWLLAELVVVTVVTWVIIDPVVVLWHDTSLPMGYDIDRICKVELASKLPMAKDYDRTASDADAQALLIDKMRMHPSVAIACPLGNKYLSSRGHSSGSLQIYNENEIDNFKAVLSRFGFGNYFRTVDLLCYPRRGWPRGGTR